MKPASTREWKSLGKFDVTSGKLVVSDPCYERGTWCQKENLPAVNGAWEAFVTYDPDEGRVAALMALGPNARKDGNWKEEPWDIGVDSGQAGVFRGDDRPRKLTAKDHKSFPNGESWYEANCRVTLGDVGAGVIPGGAVSSSGYGDGGYTASVQYQGKKALAVLIDYIPEFIQCHECSNWVRAEKAVEFEFCSQACVDNRKAA
jgi:hypothetical protein